MDNDAVRLCLKIFTFAWFSLRVLHKFNDSSNLSLSPNICSHQSKNKQLFVCYAIFLKPLLPERHSFSQNMGVTVVNMAYSLKKSFKRITILWLESFIKGHVREILWLSVCIEWRYDRLHFCNPEGVCHEVYLHESHLLKYSFLSQGL